MWHLMWLTLSFVCCLSTINYVVAAPIDSDEEAAVKFRFNYIIPGFVNFSHMPIILVHQRKSAIKPADLAIRITLMLLICMFFFMTSSFRNTWKDSAIWNVGLRTLLIRKVLKLNLSLMQLKIFNPLLD
jgi:hypothetical protein